ncbi:helix-turn-helix domain-containing protein [Pendulispora rubella]|uniref:Helix-turn-helix domain-containing protein n=1 Tax=Pendulispora rubella TaxID=2741070 RepID=A0ABZ2L7X0_9BACT
MLYLSHVPSPPLCEFVANLWLLSDAPPHQRERIVPSGTLELVINLQDDEIRIYDRVPGNPCARYSGMLVSGAYGRFFVIDTAEHALMMGVHFRPGGAFPFLGMPAKELADAHVEGGDLWGSWASELRERLCSATTHAQRFRLLEGALRARALDSRPRRPEVRFGVETFQRPRARVRDVAAHVGLSHRHFNELFANEVGTTPKLFYRIQRFQRTIEEARRNVAPDWARLARECGYFDQSHMIADFLAFSGLSPVDYVLRQTAQVKENHVALA